MVRLASPWPREAMRAAADRAGSAARGRRRRCGGRWRPRPSICSRAAARTARSSSSARSPTGRQGSTRAAKQASLLKMLPMPATRVWSSRASPRSRLGVGARPATTASRSSSGARMSGPRRASWGSRRRRSAANQPQGRAAELDRLLPSPASTAQAERRGLRQRRAAGVDVPGAVHPQVAVEDEVAEVEQQVLAVGRRRGRGGCRRGARRRRRARAGWERWPSPSRRSSAASRRRAARRIVSPSAIGSMMTGA